MLGEALKASASDESTALSPFKLTSQAVGILAVLGLSGAVAILTLSKQKLWHYLVESTQTTSVSMRAVASNSLSSQATPSSTPTASLVDDWSTTDVGAHDSSDSRVEELTSEETSCGTLTNDVYHRRARTGISFAVTADDPPCEKSASETMTCAGELAAVLPVQPYTPPPAEPGRKTRHVLKKVQFAPDVVEPSGDGREYRGRIRTARYLSNNMSGAGKLKCLNSGDKVWDCPLSCNAGENAVINGHGFQILGKPKLPANRMALYSGMLGYRSQMTLDC